jgi:hypothetical protein
MIQISLEYNTSLKDNWMKEQIWSSNQITVKTR